MCECVSPRSALCAASAPRRTEKALRPHRCSRRPISPDIFGAPGRGASRLCEPDLVTTGKLKYGQVPFRSNPWSGGISPHGLVYGPPRVLAHAELEQEQLLLEEDHLLAAGRVSRFKQTLRRSCSRRS